MAHLIDKDTLVTEIEKRMQELHPTNTHKMQVGERVDRGVLMWLNALTWVKELINSLEVKEVNLENSMVCKVDWYDGFLLDYTQEQQDTLLEKIGATCGDKIRVILIKE